MHRVLPIALIGLAALALGPTPSQAAQTVRTGTYTQPDYNDYGTWNYGTTARGLRVRDTQSGSPWVDPTWPGSPWTYVSFEYNIGSTPYSYYASYYGGNVTRVSQTYTNSGGVTTVTDVWRGTGIEVTKIDKWSNSGVTIGTRFLVKNTGSSAISSFRIMHALDPDQDSGGAGGGFGTSTYNDAVDLDGDSIKEWVQTYGGGGWTVAYGACNPAKQEVGIANWDYDTDVTLTDPNNATGDLTMHWRHKEASIASGDTLDVQLVTAWGDSVARARSSWASNKATYCNSCDEDGDGYASLSCGGGDCDDSDKSIHPGATEVAGDEIDQNCDTREVCFDDADNDGWRLTSTRDSANLSCRDSGEALASEPTLDCNDSVASIYPGAFEIVGDETDQSCDGSEVCYADLDDDGWRTTETVVSSDVDCSDTTEASASEPTFDCDDRSSSVYPGAVETAYDGIDQDCNGLDLCDVDEDGYDADMGSCVGVDCDDNDVLVNPGADEIWYDGLDADCDGWSDYDADYDGYDSADYAGEDCDDTDDAVNPGAGEIWYDGVDQDCNGGSDYDGDGDGYDSSEFGGEDCNDNDATVYPGAPELNDGIDNDCNGVDEDDDRDGDGVTDEDELVLGTDPDSADTDGDGLSDGVEVGDDSSAPLDSDGDGVIDALDVDDDDDGILTEVEVGEDTDNPADSDGDGTPDYLDLDSDADGFGDEVEGENDSDVDGIPDYLDDDADNDTVLDVDELDEDTDGDGVPNRLDPDDDADGWMTEVEETWEPDLDGDGVPNYLDPDSDGDGINDLDEGMGDSDCDSIDNVFDNNDADGPCAVPDALTFQSGACSGASSTAVPLGGAGLLLTLLGLVGVRRRRS